MNGFLLDTNVISEFRKGARAHPSLLAWFQSIEADSIYLSVLVLGEIRRGIEQARVKDPEKARSLERWMTGLSRLYGDRFLPVTLQIADEWGHLNVARPVPSIDGLMAATAIVHDLTLVTRNVNDVTDTGVSLLNPFE